MRFWDTSAVVPLLVEEPLSARTRELLEWDAHMSVWWGTPAECWSALARLRRAGTLSAAVEDGATARLEALRASWWEMLPSEEVRSQSRRLLRVHAIRSQDALQLAAALVWSGHALETEFVGADRRLNEAARLEGLSVVDLTSA